MKLKQTLVAAALGFGMLTTTGAHAALTLTLGGQGVYDSDLNLTWLANANLAATNTFGVGGISASGDMTWNAAQSWIGAMNAANYLGFNDWRLPATLQPDASCGSQYNAGAPYGTQFYGYNCTGSEMGHLFYTELGGTAGSSILSSSDPDLALFQNVQSSLYWSGTEYAPSTSNAWYFDTGIGFQSAYYKGSSMFAWAVRPGNSTAVSAVPEPETYAMLLAGLGLLGFTARRRARS
ncbi:MAG: hypothetical protein FD134_2361 [Gallionellaceae bacterium]|nr:MAG: hypothetical protein FD134_2361 [Gallionellaceae bacterium]